MSERVSFNSAAVERALARLEARVAEGQYYEAQQMYKSTYHRYKAKQNYEDGYKVLQAGCRLQMQHAQVTCGSELLRMLLEAYLEQKVEAAGARLDEVLQLLALFKASCAEEAGREEAVLELRRAAGAAIQWCSKCGDRHATRKLFGAAGAAIMAMQGWKGLGIATQYFCLSDDMLPFAEGVKLGMANGRPAERDLFMARAVLQVLAAASKETMVTQLDLARDLWQRLPQSSSSELQHFVDFLLVALGKLSKPIFDLLFTKYGPCLKRDDYLWSLVDRVKAVYFGKGDPGDAIGGLLSSLFGAMGEDEL